MTDSAEKARRGDGQMVASDGHEDAEQLWQERLELFAVAMEIAEKLDELERNLDPSGEPPRHAAMTQQRLRAMTERK